MLPQVIQPLRLLNTANFKRALPPVSTPRCQRSAKAASGSPLGGCVGVQHSGALHPCPNRVHPGHHGLFFHTTPTPLDALVDAKHQNAPSHCRYLSLSSLSILLYLAPSFSLPCLPSSSVCLIALSEEQSGVVCFTWRLVARVSQSKQKMRHVEGKGELSASRVSWTSCQRLQKKKEGGSAVVEMNDATAMKGGNAGSEAAPSWRQSLGSRCSWQKRKQNVSFCNKQSVVRQRNQEIKHVPRPLDPTLYSQSPLPCSDEWNGRLRAIKRQSWATAAPLLVSFCSGDFALYTLPRGITLDHLWDAKQQRTSRRGRRGLHGEQERPPKHS